MQLDNGVPGLSPFSVWYHVRINNRFAQSAHAEETCTDNDARGDAAAAESAR
jgi:hypothetical protein